MTAASPALPTLADLPAAAWCESCGCCPADLCAAALTDGTACLMLAAPRPDPAAAEVVLRCPCSPVACHCSPPVHVRGIARCQHGQRAGASRRPGSESTMTTTTPAALAEIDAAALHMARTYGPDTEPDADTLKRWAGRIRKWATRYPRDITDHGREGRRRRYDLDELQRVAERVLPEATAAGL